MNFRFDHLVYAAKEPGKMSSICEPLGLHVLEGGRHERWGSYNSLSYFGLSYIEFLGIDNWKVPAQEKENRLIMQTANMLQKGDEGPLRIALRTDHIEKVAETLREQGVHVFGPFPGERTRMDGKTIKWSLLFPENTHDSELNYPFIIQWDHSDKDRLAELEADQFIGQHSLGNGFPTLSDIGFVVNNLDRTVKQWSQLFDLQCTEVFIDETLQSRSQKLSLPGTELLFCEPIGDGPVMEVLRSRGEAPFLIQLCETGKSDFIQTLNCFWKFQ